MRVVIAGGGTGGHLYPGIALAETFIKLRSEAKVLFVGTARGIGENPLLKKGYRFEAISSKGFIGKGLGGRIASLLAIPAGLIESIRILSRFSPQIVIGIGGYSAGPVLLAAILLRIKRVILEPNVVPGLSNRLVAPFCHMVVTAFAASQARLRTHRIRRLGVPVRPEIGSKKSEDKSNKSEKISPTLLILGGSQGAHSINQAIIAALPLLKDLKRIPFIIHQTGKSDCEKVQAAYDAAQYAAEVTAFIDDMAGAYAAADLVVSRAGAGTLSELAIAAKGSILIPFPHAGGHQEENALAFVKEGAAIMLRDGELSGPKLTELVQKSLADPERLKLMEEAAKRQGNKNAAEDIVRACLALVEKKERA